jgi:hypothetical protein
VVQFIIPVVGDNLVGVVALDRRAWDEIGEGLVDGRSSGVSNESAMSSLIQVTPVTRCCRSGAAMDIGSQNQARTMRTLTFKIQRADQLLKMRKIQPAEEKGSLTVCSHESLVETNAAQKVVA